MSRLKLSLLLVLQALGIFALFRGLLFVAYYEEFSALSLFEILQAKIRVIGAKHMYPAVQEKPEQRLLAMNHLAYRATKSNNWVA